MIRSASIALPCATRRYPLGAAARSRYPPRVRPSPALNVTRSISRIPATRPASADPAARRNNQNASGSRIKPQTLASGARGPGGIFPIPDVAASVPLFALIRAAANNMIPRVRSNGMSLGRGVSRCTEPHRGFAVACPPQLPVPENVDGFPFRLGQPGFVQKILEGKIRMESHQPEQRRKQPLQPAHHRVGMLEMIHDEELAARPTCVAHLGYQTRRMRRDRVNVITLGVTSIDLLDGIDIHAHNPPGTGVMPESRRTRARLPGLNIRRLAPCASSRRRAGAGRSLPADG